MNPVSAACATSSTPPPSGTRREPDIADSRTIAVPASDHERIDRLRAQGATITRHAHVMRLPLPTETPYDVPEFLRFAPGGRPPIAWADVLPSWLSAYPPDHPDHLPGGESLIDSYFVHYTADAALGPLIDDASAIAVVDGRAVGGLLMVDRPDEGPWVCDIWRHPDQRYAGTGTSLLRWSASRLGGYPSIGLAVTVSNARAVRAYERVGFVIESTDVTLRIAD